MISIVSALAFVTKQHILFLLPSSLSAALFYRKHCVE